MFGIIENVIYMGVCMLNGRQWSLKVAAQGHLPIDYDLSNDTKHRHLSF